MATHLSVVAQRWRYACAGSRPNQSLCHPLPRFSRSSASTTPPTGAGARGVPVPPPPSRRPPGSHSVLNIGIPQIPPSLHSLAFHTSGESACLCSDTTPAAVSAPDMSSAYCPVNAPLPAARSPRARSTTCPTRQRSHRPPFPQAVKRHQPATLARVYEPPRRAAEFRHSGSMDRNCDALCARRAL